MSAEDEIRDALTEFSERVAAKVPAAPRVATLDGEPFANPGHYRSHGREGEIDQNSPMMRQQPHLPPSGTYWVRHFRRRRVSLAGVECRDPWWDVWVVARVTRPAGEHGDGPCPGNDHHPGRLYMLGQTSRECEDLDLSEAEWVTLLDPDESSRRAAADSAQKGVRQ